MGGKVIGLATLAIGGIIFASALIHPQGVRSIAAGANTLVGTTSSAILGGAKVRGQ